MRIALFILSAAAAVLAWIIARRRPEHRPIALAISIYFLASLGRAVLLARVLPPNPRPSDPALEGVLRAAVYFERGLFIAWPFALAAAAVHVLARRRAWPIAVAYALAVAVLVAGYPALRFNALRRAYLAIELTALAAGVASIGAWWRRSWHRARAGDAVDEAAGSTRIALVLVVGHSVVVITTYGSSLFGEAWGIARGGYLAILGAVVVLQLVEVLRDDA